MFFLFSVDVCLCVSFGVGGSLPLLVFVCFACLYVWVCLGVSLFVCMYLACFCGICCGVLLFVLIYV